MRYYDIRITDPITKEVIVPFPFKMSPVAVQAPQGQATNPIISTQGDTSYTSHPGGVHNPNALDIEIQIRNVGYNNSIGDTKQGSFVRIYGVSLPEIGQQFKFHDKNIVIQGGMQKGLPLAKPEQAGILVSGQIWQALGNWEGVDKTLEFMVYGANVRPSNFQFVWEKGQPLITAIRRTIAGSSLGDLKVIDAMSSELKNNRGKTIGGTYFTLEAFANAVYRLSKDPQFSGIKTLTGSAYQGVQIYKRSGKVGGITVAAGAPGGTALNDILVVDNTKIVTDSRSISDALILKYEDFIGQPTWINPTRISWKMVMRADIRLSDYIRFPTIFGSLLAQQTPAGAQGNESPSRNQLAFEAAFQVQSVMHFGKFRSSGAASWATTFEGNFSKIPLPGGGTAP